MSKDPRPPADPRDPALAPDNIWSSRRLRRRHDAARKAEKAAATEYTASPRRFAMLSTLTGGAGMVILATTLTALVWYFLRKPDKAAAAGAGTEPGEKWQGAVPGEALDGFIKATTHAERMRWVRSPELVEPLVTAFYTTGPGSREKVSLTASIPPPALDPGQPAYEIARYAVLMEDNSKRLVSIVTTPDGARVDFHAYSRHASVPWPNLLEGRAPGAVVRLFISSGRFHAVPFASETDWLALTGVCPDVPADLLLYARRGTPECAALEAILTDPLNTVAQRVTLTIGPVQESWRQHMFQVTAFHAREWLGRQK